ncbi:hypothetical protein [Cupriavidus sp. CP313]
MAAGRWHAPAESLTLAEGLSISRPLHSSCCCACHEGRYHDQRRYPAEDRTIATTLEVADPSKTLIQIMLSQLLARRSKRNARTTARMSIPQLAA